VADEAGTHFRVKDVGGGGQNDLEGAGAGAVTIPKDLGGSPERPLVFLGIVQMSYLRNRFLHLNPVEI
jgi:hypothetical protein